jgi:hypothetical protein
MNIISSARRSWALALILVPLVAAGPRSGTLDVTWIDSEGGGSTLIVTPLGESILIDAGNPGGRDAGRIVVMNNGPRKGGQPGAFAAFGTAGFVQALYQVHRSFNVPQATNAPYEYVANHDDLTSAAAAACPAQVIRMSVARDALSYTIQVPANSHSRTFSVARR